MTITITEVTKRELTEAEEKLIFMELNKQRDDGLPWFLVTTPDGDIKIGYRKRVIHIEWMNNYKPFTETFENESVTKCFQAQEVQRFIHAQEVQRFIHAWTLDKAMEYLRKAKEMINNEYC